jgi:short subunit dehydrogenase-like uncharacterized protein
MVKAGREFDVVLWGATGFTGELVAEYLLAEYGVGGDLRWALAGRNQSKLEALKGRLVERDAQAAGLSMVAADSHDLASLKAMASRTKVVCTTVGPYLAYGLDLVEACIDEGAHYCDLTGETPFIRKIIDRWHDKAEAAGVKIVNSCGFDSIPSDLGCLVVQEHAIASHGQPLDCVKYYLGKTRGGMSGGTVASMLGIVEQASDPELRRVLLDAYALNPKGAARGPDKYDQQDVRWDEDINGWTGPFVMAGINTRIVRRSNALMDFRYGEQFRYNEVQSFPKGKKGKKMASRMRLGIGLFLGLAAIAPTRWLLKKTILPAPGDGPSREERENGCFYVTLVGKGSNAQGADVKVKGEVISDLDPGYAGTARMLAETAVCLAKDENLPDASGILTPSVAMGMPLVDRLRAKGMTFSAA